jgi:SAM-dependent methyltransferase
MKSPEYEARRLRLLAGFAEGNVLDIGYAAMPNPHLLHLECTGLDLLPPPDTGPHYSTYIQGDVSEVGVMVGDRRFSTIVCGEFIEHMEEPYRFLRDIRPLLKANGRVILSTPNPLGFPVIFLEAIRSKAFFYSADHTYYFTPRWVERLLGGAGYEVTNVKSVGVWLPRGYLPWCPVAMSYQVIYVAKPR